MPAVIQLRNISQLSVMKQILKTRNLVGLLLVSDRNKIYNLLRSLKKEGLVEFVGYKRTGYWKLS
jgi:hypothetical protein